MSLLNIRERGVIVGVLDTETAEVSDVKSPALAALMRQLKSKGIRSLAPTHSGPEVFGVTMETRKVGPDTIGLLIPALNRAGFLCDRERGH